MLDFSLVMLNMYASIREGETLRTLLEKWEHCAFTGKLAMP